MRKTVGDCWRNSLGRRWGFYENNAVLRWYRVCALAWPSARVDDGTITSTIDRLTCSYGYVAGSGGTQKDTTVVYCVQVFFPGGSAVSMLSSGSV